MIVTIWIQIQDSNLCVDDSFYGMRLCECVAVCCSVLQCVAVFCSMSQCVAVCCSVSQRVAVCCSVSQCVACVDDSFHGMNLCE